MSIRSSKLTSFWVFCFSLLINGLFAQDPRLALQYFQSGEYEKAAGLYKSLVQSQPNIDIYYNNYLECLMSMKQFDEAESLIKKEIAKKPKDCIQYYQLGNLAMRQNEPEKAEKHFLEAINKLQPEVIIAYKLANLFGNQNRYDLSIQVYEKAQKLMGEQADFNSLLADLYRKKNEPKKMLQYYMKALKNGSIDVNQLGNQLIVYLPKELYPELQAELYSELEKKPDQSSYIELLAWSFIQNKDYMNAMRQTKSLDRLLNENGARVYQLAYNAMLESDYRTAIDGFSYLKAKGQAETYYLEASRHILICRRKQIVEKNNYNHQDLLALESDYEQFKNEYGTARLVGDLWIEYAELEAKYLNKLSKAIDLLEQYINLPNVDPQTKARAKLDLGDYYLIAGERWEATLLYSQVDKDFLEDQLGEDARFRNARLSYYAGDFTWAQEQFDILKRATSRLISNDAIDLSVFILDNLAKDTLGEALRMYSQAELKVFQNLHDDALLLLDSIRSLTVENTLEDDVWYLQGKIFNKLKETDKAIERFERVVEKYKDDIRADNSLFELAKIYDYQKEDKEKAKQLYEKLFMEFSGSILAVEARKRFRQLRGDQAQ